MIKFIGKRLILFIPVLLGVTFLIFSMLYFTPGDVTEIILGETASAEDKAEFERQMGLDQPYLTQYFNYLKNLVTKGDLGLSYTTKRPVTIEIVDRFPTTLKLATISILIAIMVGIPMGIISATRQYSLMDNIATMVTMVGVSVPNFWLAMMLILVFSVGLGWLPPSGTGTPLHWILPAATASSTSAATIMRMTRSSMLEVIRQDYIRTARAKGQTELMVIIKHALHNALIPIITVVGLQFGSLMASGVIIETVFSIAGLGKLMVDAIKVRNFPLIQGGILFIAFVMCVINLLVDVLYAYVDPRIRSQYVTPNSNYRKKRGASDGAKQ